MNTQRSRGSGWKWGVGILVVVVIVAVGAYLGLRHHQQQATPTTTESAPAPPASAPSERHPISQANVNPAQASTTPLPALDDSDAMVRDALAKFGGEHADRLLSGKALIPRMVATINALTTPEVSARLLPVRAPSGRFMIAHDAEGVHISPANSQRYARYVALLEHTDTQTLVTWYVHNYPLFEQAWRQLGYPDTHFNDRLIHVLDNLLAAPSPKQPPELVAHGGVYKFANSDMEHLPAGQKMMLRLGSDQEAKVKAKLSAIRAALVGQDFPASGASAAAASSSG